MNDLLHISNEDQKVVKTNFWDTQKAKEGYFYLSWNAGAARLLIPDNQQVVIKEMKTAKEVIISRGILQGEDALELLFEDNTDCPFSIHITTSLTDRLLPETDQGEGFEVVLWTRSGIEGSFKGKYRVVDSLPCLNPWVVQ